MQGTYLIVMLFSSCSLSHNSSTPTPSPSWSISSRCSVAPESISSRFPGATQNRLKTDSESTRKRPEKIIQKHFPAKKGLFLQKNALSCRKMRFSDGQRAGNCRNRRRVSGHKSQERYPTFTRKEDSKKNRRWWGSTSRGGIGCS